LRHNAVIDAFYEFGGDSIKYMESDNVENVWALIEFARIDEFWKLANEIFWEMKFAE
jgi:hypothetical protein